MLVKMRRDAPAAEITTVEQRLHDLGFKTGRLEGTEITLIGHQARFPTTASLESFDWSFNAQTIPPGPFQELAMGQFLARRDNLVFVGKSGLGKSHLIQVRYYRAFDLLIIDEFGFDKLERREYPESPSLLYKVVDSRSGRGSTAFVTNVDFGDWTDYLGDPPLVMALLDRVVDSAIVQKFEGISYRKHRAEQKQKHRSS